MIGCGGKNTSLCGGYINIPWGQNGHENGEQKSHNYLEGPDE